MAASLSDSSLRLLISLKNTGIWQYMLEERKVNSSGKKKSEKYIIQACISNIRLFKIEECPWIALGEKL